MSQKQHRQSFTAQSPLFCSKTVFLVCLFFLAASVSAAPWLGLSFKKAAYQNQIALEIQGVHPGSGGMGKIRVGDKIISVDGSALTDLSVIQKRVAGARTGESISLGILRGGKTISVKVKLTERPDDITSLTGSAIGSKATFGKNFYANAEKRKAHPKVTLLDFWATWCGPCRMTIPKLERLYKKYSSRGLEVIGISDEAVNVLNDFYKTYPGPYPLYNDRGGALSARYGISAVPTLMLLDSQGYIQQVWTGAPDESALEQVLQNALK